MNREEKIGDKKLPEKAEAPEKEPLDSEVTLPEPVEVALQHIPPAEREKVRETFAALLQFQGPVLHPVFRKLTENHVTKLIDGAEKDNERMYIDRRETRAHVKFLSVAGIVGFVVVAAVFLWMQETSLLERIIEIAVIFAGGIGAGVGISRRRE